MPRGMPLYHRILELLRDRIRAGRYAVGTQLPTEETLVAEFGVSRHTMREAVQQLVADGIVERFPGRGSFIVRRVAPASHWSIESVEDLIGISFADRYEVVAARFVRADRHPATAALYELAPGDRIFELRAVRSSPTRRFTVSSSAQLDAVHSVSRRPPFITQSL